MCKVTKCLYKKLFYRDTNPTQLTVPACGFQTHMRSASHRSEGLYGVNIAQVTKQEDWFLGESDTSAELHKNMKRL